MNYYGETKLESEKVIRDSGINFLIIRTNVLYGFGYKVKLNFFLSLLDKLSKKEKIKIVTEQFNNPTLVDNLSSCILEMVEKDVSGVYHIGGSEYLSRYDFAVKVAKSFGLDNKDILPTKTELLRQRAKTHRAQKVLDTRLLSVDEGLNDLKQSEELKGF